MIKSSIENLSLEQQPNSEQKVDNKQVSPSIANAMLGDVYFYKSSIDIEHYWCGSIYIMLQDISDTFLNINPYARIHSSPTFDESSFLDYLKEKGEIKITSKDDFLKKLERAFDIVRSNIA